MYDSKLDTLLHINRVSYFILRFLLLIKDLELSSFSLLESSLIHRGNLHDKSKLEKLEKGYFDVYTPKLKQCDYGSDEYNKYLAKMQIALKHHYSNNRHHPEHSGYNNMTVLDKVEMLCDWLAAIERHENGDIYKSIEINKQRFNYDDKEYNILLNTAKMIQENKLDKDKPSLFTETKIFMDKHYNKS